MNEPSGAPAHRFTEITQRIDRLYEEFARAKGMTYLSMAVLDVIYDHPDGCTQKQICAQTHYPKQSVNLIIKSFLTDGLVALRETPEDRRNKLVTLTARGQDYARATVGALWDIDRRSTESLSPAQQEQLVQLLTLYADAFARGIRENTGAQAE